MSETFREARHSDGVRDTKPKVFLLISAFIFSLLGVSYFMLYSPFRTE